MDKEFNLNVGTSDCFVIPKMYIYYTNQNKLNEFIKLFNDKIKEFAFTLYEFDEMTKLSDILLEETMLELDHYIVVKIMILLILFI